MHSQFCNAVLIYDILPFARSIVLQHSIRILFCKKLSVCPKFVFRTIVCNFKLFSRAIVAPQHFLMANSPLPSSNKLLRRERLVCRISSGLGNIRLHRMQCRLTIQVLYRHTTSEQGIQHRDRNGADCQSTCRSPHYSLILVSIPSQTTRPVLRSYNARRSLYVWCVPSSPSSSN